MSAAALILSLALVSAIYFVVDLVAPIHESADRAGAPEPELSERREINIASLLSDDRAIQNKKLFKKNCSACHTSKKGVSHKAGPNLWGVVGRQKASAEGYRFSKALSALVGEWTIPEIDAFLASPKTYLPKSKMKFKGIKDAKDRNAIISYLLTITDQPAPKAR